MLTFLIFVVVAVVLAAAIIVAVHAYVAWSALQIQKHRSRTGAEGMVGLRGEVVGGGFSADIDGGGLLRGRVRVRGELWDAIWQPEAGEPAQPAEAVEVVAVSGLVLLVGHPVLQLEG